MARRGNRDNDGKYFRLTGLWPSKKNDRLWTGKVRNQDLGKFLDKVEEADKANADVIVFLWENTEKNGKKDPEFTVQISVSEDENQNSGLGRSSGSSRRSSRNDEREEEEQEESEEEPDEKEERSSRRRESSKTETKEEPKSRRSGAGKKDKNDW